MADGRVLLLKDSVKEEPNLAVTLLRGLALPRDYDQVPTDLLPGLGEMCSHLVQTGQAALKAYDKAAKVSAERERYRTDRDNFRTKFKISETQLQETDAEVEKLKKELAEAKAAASTAEAVVEKMKKEEKEKMREADAKGYEAGIKLGYAAGADAMVVEADSIFLKQLPQPVIPNLELPYTEEECVPLPPEEDEDKEMADAEASGLEKPTEGEKKQDQAAVAEGEDGAATTLNLLT
ncbi:hypothetical protein RHGRI_037293 [Rhododendron griersonianum]|uniref:Uncharacterized protein n=1 Tax=Rhododendron griersonianum TaxID=479676 RepID=A0AAV6HWW7_9ERIC|nr:hypothetical protein RHGRI_037293 [Rhododendron griersonianum]